MHTHERYWDLQLSPPSVDHVIFLRCITLWMQLPAGSAAQLAAAAGLGLPTVQVRAFFDDAHLARGAIAPTATHLRLEGNNQIVVTCSFPGSRCKFIRVTIDSTAALQPEGAAHVQQADLPADGTNPLPLVIVRCSSTCVLGCNSTTPVVLEASTCLIHLDILGGFLHVLSAYSHKLTYVNTVLWYLYL
jgi:hypothetical protein